MIKIFNIELLNIDSLIILFRNNHEKSHLGIYVIHFIFDRLLLLLLKEFLIFYDQDLQVIRNL